MFTEGLVRGFASSKRLMRVLEELGKAEESFIYPLEIWLVFGTA